MPVYIGCDVGTVGVQVALAMQGEPTFSPTSLGLQEVSHDSPVLAGCQLFILPSARFRSDPLSSGIEIVARIAHGASGDDAARLCVTGSGGKALASRLGAPFRNECVCLAEGLGSLYPDVTHVCEIGGERSRFLSLSADRGSARVGIEDYELSGECAAGTGSFLDQQATRLRFRIEEVGDVALSSPRAARIAGRCSVFAKTDMIHAQQKGASPEEVLRGLCLAVARNFKANLLRGRALGDRVAFIGGVAENRAVLESLREVLGLNGQLFSPPFPAHYGAIGAALLARRAAELPVRPGWMPATSSLPLDSSVWKPLDLAGVVLLRDRAQPARLPRGPGRAPAYLGIDVGSVSTNLVCTDAEGNLLHEIYLRTEGRPVEAVGRGLQEIEEHLGSRISIAGAATTGSGRELIGELLGADAVHDEITAHKTGAAHVAQRYLGRPVDTIFEIGGQDSKYISLRDGVVVDFAMNEACAAGTGSFLEEQAEKLGVRIEGEFSQLALESAAPLKLGERCTVFMERDVGRHQASGAALPDLVAGLAYAVVENYLNRVVHGRPIGDVVFFQGGTAFNDSVAAAFSKVLGKRIVVPPHNGVLGAYGAALLARDRVLALGTSTRFRGFRIGEAARVPRVFTCSGCSNSCDIQEFTIEGRKSYWGDKCSERFRRQAKVPVEPVIPDLLLARQQALEGDYLTELCSGENPCRRSAERALRRADGRGSRGVVGIPRALYAHEQLPFWSTYLRALGFRTLVSPVTTRTVAELGVASAVAEPCFPVQVAHGHAVSLLAEGVDYVLVPNVVSAACPDSGSLPAYACPWGQTLPFVIAASPAAQGARSRLLAPTVHFQEGTRTVEQELWQAFRPFGVGRSDHRAAVRLAFAAHDSFRARLAEAGAQALEVLRRTGKKGIVLLGRPYNLFDTGVNLGVPQKLRALYGVNVLPLDMLPLEGIEVADVNDNMYWNYGRKILQAARFVSRTPGLHALYITNFKCGPDSYVKQFAQDAAGKPFLVLQFDGHGNDAGALTRCEAYLDSLGVLQWWSAKTSSKDEPSSYRESAPGEPSSARLRSAA
ncbi:MAG: hypothetical protein HZB55_15645 [Deltaproteobacteria bacterium]|nr:hypothetical protein [Deltaproteobacteria bacterium]